MKKPIKIISKLSTVLLVAAMLVMIFSIYCKMTNRVPRLLGYSVLTISTGSMEPTYPVGSCLLGKSVAAEKLEVGDVICFYSTDPAIYGMPNTHRIVEVIKSGSSFSFRTKGDANQVNDEKLVDQSQIIGKVVKRLGIYEKAHKFMMSTWFYVIFIFLPLLVLMVSEIYGVVAGAKALKIEEAQAAAKKASEEEKIKECIGLAGLEVNDELIGLVKQFGPEVLDTIKNSQKKEEIVNDSEDVGEV